MPRNPTGGASSSSAAASASAAARSAAARPAARGAAPERRDSDATSSDDTEDDGSSGSGGSEGGSGGGSEGDESDINVDFSFTDPRPIDFKSVRRLLERLLPGEEASFPVSSLAEDVIAQRAVGTMVKVPEDGYDDAYAFATLLPLGRFADRDWLRALRAFTLRRAAGRGGDAARDALAAVWDAPASLGLLLNERIYNMPPEIAPPLHEALLQDVAWAKESAPLETRAAFHALTHVLVVAPLWLERAEGGGGGGTPAPACEAPGAAPPGWEAHYFRFEEELWAREATFSVAFPVASRVTDAALAAAAATEAAPEGAPGEEGGAPPPPRGKKRKAGEGGGGGGEAAEAALRVPELRRVMLVPVEALTRAAAAMAQRLREGAAAAAAAAAAPSAAAAAAGGGIEGGKKKAKKAT
jgi:hypothetical protein